MPNKYCGQCLTAVSSVEFSMNASADVVAAREGSNGIMHRCDD